jgi:hypothetical protein
MIHVCSGGWHHDMERCNAKNEKEPHFGNVILVNQNIQKRLPHEFS